MHSGTLRQAALAALLAAGVASGAEPMQTSVEPAVAAGGSTVPEIELLLPPCLYAAPGLECSLYFENTVLVINPANLAFDVGCLKGSQQRERWTFTPKEGEVGDYALSLTVYGEGNRLLGQAGTVVRVVDPAAKAALSVLIVGDSLTNASVYPAQVLENAASDERLEIRLIGTNVPRKDNPALRHEGYGGWTAARFVSHYETEAWRDGRRAGSPFVFMGDDGKPVLDYARYCREVNEGKAPDAVTILLGCNDTFGATEENQADAINACLANMDTLVRAIRAFGPATAIGILLPAPPAGSQDAFGANYGCGQTRWQYRRNQHRLVRAMTERYGKRQQEGIDLLPSSVVVDPLHGFPTQTVKANARSTVDMVRLSNGVHPNECGYRQIGDALYGWLKALAARAR
jgi:lysophospholipase L1-like esterase